MVPPKTTTITGELQAQIAHAWPALVMFLAAEAERAQALNVPRLMARVQDLSMQLRNGHWQRTVLSSPAAATTPNAPSYSKTDQWSWVRSMAHGGCTQRKRRPTRQPREPWRDTSPIS